MAIVSHQSDLLSLPVEVRARILCYLLSSCQPLIIWLSTTRGGDERTDPNYQFSPEVLRVNRQLYSEGKAILYDNTLTIQLTVGYYGGRIDPPEVRMTTLRHYREPRELIWGENSHFRESMALFRKFHITILLGETFHKLRTKQAVQQLVMNLNEKCLLSKPRTLMLSCQMMSDGKCCHTCWIYTQTECEQRGICPGGQRRLIAKQEIATYLLTPFEFMKKVGNVDARGAFPYPGGLETRIRDPKKPLDLFPRYWAMLSYLQWLSKDQYTNDVGEDCENDFFEALGMEEVPWEDPERLKEDGLEPFKENENEFAVEKYWTCPPWLQSYMRRLRHAMNKGDEQYFNFSRQQILMLIQRTMRLVREGVVYQFEGETAPEKFPDEIERRSQSPPSLIEDIKQQKHFETQMGTVL
jgi:hypothetical protein